MEIPRRWPAGRDVIWSGNVKITKDQFLSSGSITKDQFILTRWFKLTLERGLPAMIGYFITRQLPYPALSFENGSLCSMWYCLGQK
ncbi:F-box family protein, partial [Prunus dulcis]